MTKAGLRFLLMIMAFCAVVPGAVFAQGVEGEPSPSPMMGLRSDGSRQTSGGADARNQPGNWSNPAVVPGGQPPASLAMASGSPAPEAADAVELSAAKQWDGPSSNWVVLLSWLGSMGPFTILTCPFPDFHTQVTALEKGVSITGRTCVTDSSKNLECYEVVDNSVASVAVQNLGYDPRPIATTPTFAGSSFWWNSEITVSANYLDPIASANIAHFYDRPAKADHATADSSHVGFASDAHFVIPADTRSTYLRVEAGGRPSPASSYISLIPPGIDFGSINGISWALQDGNVYVADGAGNAIMQVDLFQVAPVAAPLILGIPVTNPLISRVAGGSMFLYVSGVAGPTEIRSWTVGTPGLDAHYAYTTDAQFTRSITPAGIALSPDRSACFIADASTGRVVKIPVGAGGSGTSIVDNWGRYTWSFPFPCGMDVDNAGYVTVGNNAGYIAKINPSGTGWASNGSTYGTIPHAIEADRDMGSSAGTPIVYGGAAFCEAFNNRLIEKVAGEGSGTYPAPHYVGANVWDAGDGQHLVLTPDWTYWLYPHYPQRVILNNNGQTNAQVAYPAVNQTQDRIIKITANGWPSRTLHLKLADPPDDSPYAAQGGCLQGGCTQNLPYQGNDNQVDAGATYGLTTDPAGVTPAPANEMDLPFGSNDWTKDFYLKIPLRYSGNNYRIEASKVSPISGLVPNKVVGLSSAYTTWKRVLVERDRMFKRGTCLIQT